MSTITVTIHRKSSFVGAVMPYRIKINNVEYGKLLNGKTMTIEMPNEKATLHVSMIGNAMCIHNMEKEVVLFPEHCHNGRINCELTTKLNWIGFLSMGFAQSVGKVDIEVSYD